MNSIQTLVVAASLAVGFECWANEPDCNDANTTIEINQCAARQLEADEAMLQQYLLGSLAVNEDDELVAAIKHAQQAWLGYREAHCGSVYSQWRDGTMRGVMALDCKIQLTRQRTYEIWNTFLTTMDGSILMDEPQFPQD
ncbi:lysozyme inhibitor LprI family protein [Oceanobacter mangrovi]|uniref:lysozyme inhibitor LprI family protein n=1 Tax=Oceanobacter mangrovi TaxID=2862510 RepID=UPI001C8E2B6A|nr:lysozyme inhibitor LprI family protein [Oceanobacter mangrovi]